MIVIMYYIVITIISLFILGYKDASGEKITGHTEIDVLLIFMFAWALFPMPC